MNRTLLMFILILWIWGFVKVDIATSMESESEDYNVDSGFFGAPNSSSSNSDFSISTQLGPGSKADFLQDGVLATIPDSASVGISIPRSKITLNSTKKNQFEGQILIGGSSSGIVGRQIYTSQRNEMTNLDQSSPVEGTKCNDRPACTIINAEPWTRKVVGFGYNVTGKGIATDFSSPQHFRPFSLQSDNQPFISLYTSPSTENSRVQLNFRAILPVGSDETFFSVIDLLALPDF